MSTVIHPSKPGLQQGKGASPSKYLDPEGMLTLVNGYLKKAGPTFQLKSTTKYLELVAKNIEAAIHAHDRGQKYAVHSTQFPNEFFIPMGIQPLFNELYTTVVNMFSDDNQKYMEIADNMGFPCNNCSYYRCFYAMIENGAWPKPDMVCYSSTPCDQTPKGQEGAARAMGVPSFGMDRPYKLFTPQAQAYWRKEHEDLITFLEEQTGKKMDYDHLKEVAQLSFKATKVYIEINELRAALPTPLSAEAAFAAMAAYRAWVGYPELVTFLTEFRDELKERIANGQPAIPDERFRYACYSSLPFFDLSVLGLLEKRFKAVNVMDMLQWWREDADWMIDPNDPVGSLAYRVSFHPANLLHGTMADLTEEVRQMIIKMKPDCMIFFNTLGCRHERGGFRIAKDMVEREFGIPWVNVDVDVLDKTFTTKEKIADDLEGFFETVENSTPYKARRNAK
jgi:benzoyl-CoA reductase/2-hydroxyglutaryl-CoA dehydratase subunit BcrC/BadD/HgdB